MADLTPDEDLILRMADTVIDHIHENVPKEKTAATIRTELLALGWRAPGPPTEGEVERAARANIDPRTDPSDVERRKARAALTAALGRPE